MKTKESQTTAVISVDKVNWTLSDVSEQLGGVNKDKFKRRVLDRYYDDLTIEHGGPVVYPDNWPRQSRGKPWRFKATQMAIWLDAHYEQIIEDLTKNYGI